MSIEVSSHHHQADRLSIDRWRNGLLAPFLAAQSVFRIPDTGETDKAEHSVVLSVHQLQNVTDYRMAFQTWFQAVRKGGYLIVIVPHAFLYERQLELPTALNKKQRRLYTPGILIDQVEESLTPNSYRLRLLSDDDTGFDYAETVAGMSAGHSDVLLVIQKIELPAWNLNIPYMVEASTPDFGFEPQRTRVEMPFGRALNKVLILKLDHMGDFIMGLSALQRARQVFHDSEITLVVGSWNQQIALNSGIADRVIAFDAFPRNSTEEEVDVPGRTAIFRQAVEGYFDLAIDLRTDVDTRFLLNKVDAGLRAGVGTRARFPFLDIFLPLDFNRNEPETAREYKFNNHDFISQGPVVRNDHRSLSKADTVERFCAIIWGPYRRLREGRYFFEPWIELEPESHGQLLLDISLSGKRIAHKLISREEQVRLSFAVEDPEGEFEFRIWAVDGMPSIDFSFFGGRLVREGAASVLHQSEYLSLLVDLVEMRLRRTGVLTDIGFTP